MKQHQDFIKNMKDKFGVDQQSSSISEKKNIISQTLIKSPNKKRKSKLTTSTKMLNPYFKDIQINQNVQEHNQQSKRSFSNQQPLQLIIKSKPKFNQNLQKIQDKVNFAKSRRQYQQSQADPRFHQKMKKQIQDLKQYEQIQVTIGVPQIMRGNNQNVNTAIYLKNISQKQKQNQSKDKDKEDSNLSQHKHEHNKNNKVNRDQLFNKMKVQMNSRKSVAMKNIKECFKVSSLNDLADQHSNSRANEILEQIQSDNQSQQTKSSKILKKDKKDIPKLTAIINPIQPHLDKNLKQGQINKNIQTIKQANTQIDEESQKIFLKMTKVAKRIKQRKKIEENKPNKKAQTKSKKKLNKKSKGIILHFEEEAEVSDIESATSELSSQQFQGVSLTASMVAWIDQKEYLTNQDYCLARKKFFEDEILKQQQIVKRIQQGMLGKRKKMELNESQRKRRVRMEQTADKLEQQDKLFLKINQTKVQIGKEKQEQQNQSSNQSSKLKKLEQQLGHQAKDLHKFKPQIQNNKPIFAANTIFNTFTFVKPKNVQKRKGLLGQGVGSVTGIKIKKNYKSKSKQKNTLFKSSSIKYELKDEEQDL